MKIRYSVVVPVYNEEGSVAPLEKSIREAMEPLNLLRSMRSTVKLVNCSKLVGILPLRAFDCNANNLKAVNCPREVGRVPMRQLSLT